MSVRKITLRPETDSDISFLRSLYATTRQDVMLSGLPEQQQKEFVDSQFDAQRRHYLSHYEHADFQVVVRKKRSIGRLYVDRTDQEIRIIDIALLPEFRRQGIGSMLVCQVQSEAAAAGLPVTLHAEKFGNMAEYYASLGFETVEEKPAHVLMSWTSESSSIVC